MVPYKMFLGESIKEKIIWLLEVNNIELMAGMLAAGIGIMDDINSSTANVSYYVDSDTDVSSFRKVRDLPEDKISTESCGVLNEGEYGIWMKGTRRFYYNLYVFKTNSFFQGIISMCHAFDVDFRNYIYGYPFDSIGNQYALADYVMTPYLIAIDVPDLDDIEEEERDDENIIQPLERTDVIITIKD
jgi:hypothetical protein